jgi:hypothetical protein
MARTKGKVARFITISIGCLALVVSTSACSALPAENNDSGNDRTRAEAAIRQQDDAWLKAIGTKQLDATMSYGCGSPGVVMRRAG